MENSMLKQDIGALPPEYEQAINLHRTIMANGQLAADAFVEFCKGLKQMRDSKLYRELGYEDFDAYTVQAVGLKQRQAYNYISTYEKLGTQFLQSNANLGVTKLELLASVPMLERDDVAADAAGMSVSEIKELVAKYNSAQEQISMFEQAAKNDKAADSDERDGLISKIRELEDDLAEAQRNKNADHALAQEIARLKEQSAAAEKKAREDIKAAKLKAVDDAQKKVDAAEEKARQEVANAEKRAQEIARQQIEDSLKDVEQEKAEAIARAAALEKKLRVAANPDTLQLNFYLEAVQENFNKASDCIIRIAHSDPEAGEKFRGAVKKLLGNLSAEIGGGAA